MCVCARVSLLPVSVRQTRSLFESGSDAIRWKSVTLLFSAQSHRLTYASADRVSEKVNEMTITSHRKRTFERETPFPIALNRVEWEWDEKEREREKIDAPATENQIFSCCSTNTFRVNDLTMCVRVLVCWLFAMSCALHIFQFRFCEYKVRTKAVGSVGMKWIPLYDRECLSWKREMSEM